MKALRSTVLMALCLALALPCLAQDLHPSRRPSPMAIARTMVDDVYASITYSRPYKRGRDNIFGTQEEEALVPFGVAWRLGANEATQWTSTGDLDLAGQTLPAGTYSVWAVPSTDAWELHFSSQLMTTGTRRRDAESGEIVPTYDATNDVLVLSAATASIEEEVDQFTIRFEEVDDAKHLVFAWITTEVRVPVSKP